MSETGYAVEVCTQGKTTPKYFFLYVCGVFLCLALSAEANLLTNGGFEDGTEDAPVAWKVFVMPMEGAEGRIDNETAYEGRRSAKLHNPKLYPKEPANNWSQHFFGDIAGKPFRVRGYIKTAEATDAAIWVQCCTREPFRVLRADSSAMQTPVRGTTDWTRVEMVVDAPSKTDFLTVRCVLKGQGTAWFDGLELFEDRPEPTQKTTTTTSDVPGETSNDDAAPAAPPPSPPRTRRSSPLFEEDELFGSESLQQLRELNLLMKEELDSMREQIRLLEERISAMAQQREGPVEPIQPVEPVPPLVPHQSDAENHQP